MDLPCICRQDVQEVDIDEDGTFKYMLLRLVSKGAAQPKSRLLVRGSCRAAYHRDVLELALEVETDSECTVRPPGADEQLKWHVLQPCSLPLTS
jgi:hypothetical protein